jgi:hypothetical protein
MKTSFLTQAVRATLGPPLVAAMLSGTASARPTVWMFPPRTQDGQSLRALFEHPESWAQTRDRIDGIGFPDQPLKTKFTDDERRAWFAQLARWHLKLSLEVGAIKEWGPTAAQSFPKGARTWDKLIADGARIDSLAMDEPFSFSRHFQQQTTAYAADQTARFVAFVRQRYPNILIGDIEPYPGIPAGDMLAFIDAVQEILHHWHLHGLDFFRVDVDWMHFRLHDRAGQDGWAGVRNLQAEIQHRGLPFSLIYWAADFPSLSAAGREDGQTWERGIMDEGAQYAATGAVPDDMAIESWLQMTNPAVPETEPGTFTHSVLDFTTRYAPGLAVRR